MKFLFIFCLISVGTSAIAGKFEENIYIQGHSDPDRETRDVLAQVCHREGERIEAIILNIAEKESIPLTALTVRHVIKKNDLNETHTHYYCQVKVKGESSREIRIESQSKSIKHLKKKGISKDEFWSACSEISTELSLNENEIFQRSGTGYTLVDGNYCFVTSTYLTLDLGK